MFADVGCDHGYCSRYMLERGLCEKAYLSDISAGSLAKAKGLLRHYFSQGRCEFICADGMKGLPPGCDLVLIAGLGGEEIVRILSEGYLPERFVLQPMKNAEKVRAFLLEKGCGIETDYTFEDGAFYELIAGKREGGSVYGTWEIEYGRDNLAHPSVAFRRKLAAEREKLRGYLKSPMQRESRENILQRQYALEVIIDAIEGDL